MLAAGKLDRRIIIETSTITRGTSGQDVHSWTTFATVWAQVLQQNVREQFESAAMRAKRVKIFRIRYLSGLGSTMRIQYEGLIWNIRGITELERRVGMDVTAEAEET